MHACMDACMDAWRNRKKDGQQAERVRYLPSSLASCFPRTNAAHWPPDTQWSQHLHVSLAVLELGHAWRGDVSFQEINSAPRLAWMTMASRKSVLKLCPPTCWLLINFPLPSGKWGLCARPT